MQFQLKDAYCPSCAKPVTLATITPEPAQPDIAHLDYKCADCGPVLLRVVSLQPNMTVALAVPLGPNGKPGLAVGL